MTDAPKIPEIISFTKKWHSEPYPYISPTRPELSARGKNVIVTGGGTGIGNAIAIGLAQVGAKSVSILGRRLDKLEGWAATISKSSRETKVLHKAADLLNRSAVDAALKAIVEEIGKIDIFVSNAGSIQAPSPVVRYNGDELTRCFELNVVSTLNAIQAFMPLAGSNPIFLNTSFCLSNVAPWVETGAYSITKAANLKMMDCLAAENLNLHVPTEMNGRHKVGPDVGTWL